MTDLDPCSPDPELKEFKEMLQRVRERIPELKEKVSKVVSTVEQKLREMKLPTLAPREHAELVDIVTALPPACEVVSVHRKGIFRKKLALSIECADEEIEV